MFDYIIRRDGKILKCFWSSFSPSCFVLNLSSALCSRLLQDRLGTLFRAQPWFHHRWAYMLEVFSRLIGQTMTLWKIRGFESSKISPGIFLLPPHSTAAWSEKLFPCCAVMAFLWAWLVQGKCSGNPTPACSASSRGKSIFSTYTHFS